MIFIKDNAVTVYGFFTNDGDGKTGLTVTFSCYEGTSGTPVVNAQSATELAGGFYYYTISSGTVDANAGYVYKFVTAGTVDQAEIPGQFVTASWAEKIDDGVTLADDAITASKFDESTAFPLKSADTGATAVARTGADSDTLETLSDEIAAVASAVTTIDGVVDSILEDTGTTIPATLTTIEGKIDTIDDFLDTEIAAILADTNELQGDLTNGGRLDLILDAILEDTGTTLQADITAILADTNELQTNQGNWLTATGFSTHDAADVVTAMQAVASDFKADVSGLATAASLAVVDSIVDSILEDTGTSLPATLTTIDGKIDAVDDYVDTEVAAIKAVTDKLDTALELDGAVYRYTTNALEQAPTGGSAPTVEQIRAEIDANSTQLAAIVADTNELQTDLTNGGRLDLLIDAILEDTNELQTNQGNWITATGFSTHSAADVVTAMQAVAADFKADVSGLATAADLSVVDGIVDSILEDTGTIIPTQISGLNNLSSTDVQTAAAAALTAYDPPTNTELEARTLPAADYFDPSTDTVTLADGAHGGASATLTLSDYSDFVGGGGGGDASAANQALILAAIAALNDLSETDVAEAVLDAAAADHNDPLTIGNKINSAASAGDPMSTALPGAYVSPQAGALIYQMSSLLTTSNSIVQAATTTDNVNLRRGDTFSQAFTVGDVTGQTRVWFTVKQDHSDADADAIIQVDNTGLLRINGAAATLTDGSITVSDESTGLMTIAIKPAATSQLRCLKNLYYDIQVLVGTTLTTKQIGRLNIVFDVTKATS